MRGCTEPATRGARLHMSLHEPHPMPPTAAVPPALAGPWLAARGARRGGHHAAGARRTGGPCARRRGRRPAAVAGPEDRAPAALAHLLEEPGRLRPAHHAGMDAARRRARPARSNGPRPSKLPIGPADELRLRRHAAAAGGRDRAGRLQGRRAGRQAARRLAGVQGRLHPRRAASSRCACRRRRPPPAHAALFAAARAALPQPVPGAQRHGRRRRTARWCVRVAGLPAAWQGRALHFFPETAGRHPQRRRSPRASWQGGDLDARACRWTRSAATRPPRCRRCWPRPGSRPGCRCRWR